MLKLKGVSKFYYNKGVVATGFTKVNLELNIGEFVVITGESGSGKSTLLNVISGLDTYEEGEMYINGEETSYYGESDFEAYRKKYIGNIFQNFNLINSYTVYQNLELVLLLNGYNSKDIKDKINDILKTVDLYKYRNTKASKLSGGQKQRVAIARALLKETPIIVADEPTGNLDSKSAAGIMKLLYEISKNKLVIIVTHNYDQVSEYATRRIKMHDGKILEDTKLIKDGKESEFVDKNYGNITFLNKLKLGIRNTFNVIPKFLLLLIVYLFLTISVISEYSSVKKNDYDNSLLGYNAYFSLINDKRIVLKKKDGEYFTIEDMNKIKSLNNIDYIFTDDILLDTSYAINDEDLYLSGGVVDISRFSGNVDYGVLPKNDDEIIVEGNSYDYYLNDKKDEILKKEYYLEDYNTSGSVLKYKLKIVGIKYKDEGIDKNRFYVSEKVINDLRKTINKGYSSINTTINNKFYKSDRYSLDYNIIPSDKVSKGYMIVSENLNYNCNYYYCVNNKASVKIENLYYSDSLDLTISNTYNKNNIEWLTGYKDYDKYSNVFFINNEEYEAMFNKDSYQVSVFINNEKLVKNTLKDLRDNGYTALYLKDTLVDYTADLMIFVKILQLSGIVIAIVALFFISYFIIKIILKSRNIYFSTIRMLGASIKDAKSLLNIELILVLDIAYALALLFILLVNNNVINIDYIKNMVSYLKISDYIILYLILFIISILISNRYGNKLFKKSAMNTYREEV